MPTRFKELRLYMGLDQREMASWFGTKQSVVSLWETGKRTPPLREAAVKFGVSIDWLEGLSSRMWSERVTLLGRDYRRSLLALPDHERIRLAEVTPSERVVDAFRALTRTAPGLISSAYFARVLGLTPPAFEMVLANSAGVTVTALQRLADYTGIPERWYTLGDFTVLESTDLQEYFPLVHQMRAEGITPEDIRRIWNVIRSLRD